MYIERAGKILPARFYSVNSANSADSITVDVMCGNRQYIMVARDYLTSYTTCYILSIETTDSLRKGIIITCLQPLASAS